MTKRNSIYLYFKSPPLSSVWEWPSFLGGKCCWTWSCRQKIQTLSIQWKLNVLSVHCTDEHLLVRAELHVFHIENDSYVCHQLTSFSPPWWTLQEVLPDAMLSFSSAQGFLWHQRENNLLEKGPRQTTICLASYSRHLRKLLIKVLFTSRATEKLKKISRRKLSQIQILSHDCKWKSLHAFKQSDCF